MMKNNIKSLYIHIPFCSCICSYCDFYKMIATQDKKKKYIEYLKKEIDLKKDYLNNIKTIFIGGGTPTSLGLVLLEDLLIHLSKYIDLNSLVEFTIEANPNDINNDFALLFKKYNVNRVSLGVQSFNTDKLKFLNRTHTQSDVASSIKCLKDAAITNINIDLIFGVYNDSFDLIKEDLNEFFKLDIPHMSFYNLILEEHTILSKLAKENKLVELDSDKEAELYKSIVKELEEKGYMQYEISNFSKDGYRSIHNLTYWNNEEYVAVGASASSFIQNKRQTNIKNLNKYFEGIDNLEPILEEDTYISKEDNMSYEMILGLRKKEGVNIKKFENKFKISPLIYFKDAIGKLTDKGLLEEINGYIRIKQNFLFISNSIMMEFL